MNKVIFKMWMDAKRSHLNASKDLGILHTPEYIQGQLDLLLEIEDSWNLEEVKENSDYYLEKNF